MLKKIKSLYILAIGLGAMTLATSCDDYLSVTLQDQMTIDEVFSKRASTQRYLAHVYSYLPEEVEYLGSNKAYTDDANAASGEGTGVGRSDESLNSWYQWCTYLQFTTGDYGVNTEEFNIWPYRYTGISQATTFMNNVDKCTEVTADERAIMKAEARFVRAYCYFSMLRQYGPVFVWGDVTPDITINPETIDRNTVDENFDFILSELEKCIEVLPLTITDTEKWAGRVTKGAAMAAKARILLYRASPLFNGCDLYKGQMVNMDGNYLFPQTANPDLWEEAAQAAKAVIDLNMYSLVQVTSESDQFLNYVKSYQNVLFSPWNEECIWGCWPPVPRGGNWEDTYAKWFRLRCLPKSVTTVGYGGFSPSLKLADTYPMYETGRYPLELSNEYIDGDLRKPNPDEKSGYVATGFTENWLHPIEGKYGAIKVHNSCIGRDPRYYASILANGFRWINDKLSAGCPVVTFYKGGTAAPTGSLEGNQVGMSWRRGMDASIDYEQWSFGQVFHNNYRLAEIYLNYAEACNEKPNRNATEALKYVNLIRARVGLNKLEEAYPELNLANNQDALRQLIRKERMVELAWENHRWYDARRWMIAVKEFSGPNVTLNLYATNYEDSWERTTSVWQGADRKFTNRDYLHPINQAQLSEMKNITQNYGW